MADFGDAHGNGEGGEAPPLITRGLECTLTDLARRISAAVGHGISVGIELTPRGQWLATIGSDALAHTVTGLQYDRGQGPVLDAAVGGHYQPDLASDKEWPRFAAHAASLGVRALMMVPLTEPDGRVMGRLVLYSRHRDPFDAETRARVYDLAHRVSSTTTMLLIVTAPTGGPEDDPYGALADRILVEQAVGVLMGRGNCDARTARRLLRRDALRRGTTLREAAAHVLADNDQGPPPGP